MRIQEVSAGVPRLRVEGTHGYWFQRISEPNVEAIVGFFYFRCCGVSQVASRFQAVPLQIDFNLLVEPATSKLRTGRLKGGAFGSAHIHHAHLDP